MSRISSLTRNTSETNVKLNINLDGNGKSNINTEVGFFNHMLSLFSFHSGVDIELLAKGDLNVCDHHLVEDVGIALGVAFKEALGNKQGIKRYSTVFLPMDESLAMVSLDISGRAFLHFDSEFKRNEIGSFSTEMVEEFMRAFAFNAGITLHIKVLYGTNDHHKIEAIFKGLGRVIKEAIEVSGEIIPSSKGIL